MWQNLSTFIFGEPVRDHLPARVLEQIQARQDASERLISWAQFVLIVLFASLYLASQGLSTMMTTRFEVVPFALAAYFAFTVHSHDLVLSQCVDALVFNTFGVDGHDAPDGDDLELSYSI